MKFNPADYPICFRKPLRLTDITSWHTHIPFAFMLVDMLRPEVIVELGTHKGDSYCAFCQAVEELELKTKCYGVDTWEGDVHSGYYGSEVLVELRDFHDSQFERFSKLIQSTFDEALCYFPDKSIDLLHIDGLHLYESVKQDFENWLPKMSDRGVIIFHDTNVRERNFGVWKFWGEIRECYPNFELAHGEGLGTLAVGKNANEKLQVLTDLDEDEKLSIAKFFFNLGRNLMLRRKIAVLNQKLDSSEKKIFKLTDEIYDRDSQIVHLHGIIKENESKLATLEKENESKLATLEAEHTALKNELNMVYSSKSWRITEPLRRARELTSRSIMRFVRQPNLSILLTSGFCQNTMRRLYRVMPLSPLRKQRMKDFFLRKFLFFLQARGHLPGQILLNSTECSMLDLSHTMKLPVGPPQILVVDERLPTPDQDSGSERMSKILKLLTDIGYTITFVSGRNEKLKSYEMNLKQHGIRIIYGFHDAIKHLQELGHTYQHVFLSRPEIAFEYLAPVRAFAINATVFYDTVDLAWVRLTREAEVLGDKTILNQAEHFKRMELFNISCSDVIISITPEEKGMILRENPNCRVEVIPNIHQCVDVPNPFLLRKNLMFIGGFWHTPNQDAVFYFVNSILPLVLRDIPEVIFYIVGSNMPSSVRALESQNIRPVGYVPDVSPYFESSRVFVSPLRFGAGMKGKIGQSMSYGVPVVTNSIGAEGMGLTHEVNVLVADNAEAFAEEVVRLYSQEDLWTRLSNNSITYIQENLSETSAKERLLQIFGHAVEKPIDSMMMNS